MMSFLDRARQAAEQARAAAAAKTEQVRQVASEKAHQASVTIHEQAPIIQAQTREGLGVAGANLKVAGKSARKGVVTLVDRIDPGILADIIIKATALQEKANAALRSKGSPYRIDEITITAAIPPQLGFSIARIGDVEEQLTGAEIESASLAATLATEEFSLIAPEGDVPTDGSSEAAAAPPAGEGVAIGAGEAVVGWTGPPSDDLSAASMAGAPGDTPETSAGDGPVP